MNVDVAIHEMLVKDTEAIHVVQRLVIDVVEVVVVPTFVTAAEDNDMILEYLHHHNPSHLDDDVVDVAAAAAAAVIYEVAFLLLKIEVQIDVGMVEVMQEIVGIEVEVEVEVDRPGNEAIDLSAVQ